MKSSLRLNPLTPLVVYTHCAYFLETRQLLTHGPRPQFNLRRNLLAASIEFIGKYWSHKRIVEDPRIGEGVNAALVLQEVSQ